MTAVNISGTFRKDERPYNGLEKIADALTNKGKLHESYVVVGIVTPKFVKTNAEDGTDTPTVRFDRIEPLEGEAADAARALLDAAYQERTGRDPQMALDFGVDGEREVPEPSGEELLAEHREARATEAGDA